MKILLLLISINCFAQDEADILTTVEQSYLDAAVAEIMELDDENYETWYEEQQ